LIYQITNQIRAANKSIRLVALGQYKYRVEKCNNLENNYGKHTKYIQNCIGQWNIP